MKKTILAGLALVIASAVPSMAQTVRTENREYRQDGRIIRGINQGELTPREMRNINRQQNRIDRTQARATRDGYVSPAERRKIERMQNRASKNIARKKHNGRTMY
ncbi:MAG: hypothetical protein INR68_02990 [Methylobacterium mesophilicum]|nr:hypothetical protein [Methylobacterium mesophilicum]